jgi:hypothetical protein
MKARRLEWLTAVAAAGELDVYAKAVTLSLLAHMNAEGECWPSVETIRREGSVSKTTAIRRLNQLEQLGYLQRISRGRRQSRRYLACVPSGPPHEPLSGPPGELLSGPRVVHPVTPSGPPGGPEPTRTEGSGGGGGQAGPADAGPLAVATITPEASLWIHNLGARLEVLLDATLPALACEGERLASTWELDDALVAITASPLGTMDHPSAVIAHRLAKLHTEPGDCIHLAQARAALRARVSNCAELFGATDLDYEDDTSPTIEAIDAFESSLDDLGWWTGDGSAASVASHALLEASRRLDVALRAHRRAVRR